MKYALRQLYFQPQINKNKVSWLIIPKLMENATKF